MTGKAGERKLGLPNMQEINQMTIVELQEKLAELRAAKLGIDARTKNKLAMPLASSAQYRQTRITIARMMTVLAKKLYKGG